MEFRANVFELLDKAEKFCQYASKLQPNNDELAILTANIANARITVEPATRWEKYGEIVKTSVKEAKSINPENPRSKEGVINLLKERTKKLNL